MRARDSGLLDEIPGLVYARSERDAVAEELVDTGIQRLLGDLDELPSPVLGYRLLEPPGRTETLAARALSADRVAQFSPIGSLVLTSGCKFACPYCPIPAYNQRQFRAKSGARIASEMTELYRAYRIRHFYGADDNFFNDHARTVDIAHTLAETKIDGVALSKRVGWATEATIHDTLKLADHLPVLKRAGLYALWLGVEDMTATLIKKGQSVDKTEQAFRLLREHRIAPMAMMMHHDAQPLYTRDSAYGLLNQVDLLRRAGASSLQVLMMSPATGSKLYESSFTTGLAYESVAGRTVEPYMRDANYVIASRHEQPWRKQLNIMAAYAAFYNPARLLVALARRGNRLHKIDVAMQIFGMLGLVHTVRRTFGWSVRLMFGRIVRTTHTPHSEIPMRAPRGAPSSHALSGTPTLAVSESVPAALPARRGESA